MFAGFAVELQPNDKIIRQVTPDQTQDFPFDAANCHWHSLVVGRKPMKNRLPL